MPNYDFICTICYETFIINLPMDNRDSTPSPCSKCSGGSLVRCYLGAPEVRTVKLSTSFIDGTKRKGFEDLKKIAKLQEDQLKHKPTSEEYTQITKEIKERKKI